MQVIIKKTLFNEDPDESFLLDGKSIVYGEQVNISTNQYELIRSDNNFDIEIILQDPEAEETIVSENYSVEENDDEVKIILKEVEIFDAIYSQLSSSYQNENIIDSVNLIYSNVSKKIELKRIENDTSGEIKTRE